MLNALFTGRGLVATLVVLAGVAVLCRLGLWQLDRHSQRMAQNRLIAERMALPPAPLDPALPPEELDYRRVVLRGVFDPSQEVLLRNREYQGATGYHLITPLRLPGRSGAVLVDRGWVPLGAEDPEQRRRYAPPPGEVTVEGVARRSQRYEGGPEDPPTGPLKPRLDAWFRVDIERIERQTGYPLLPVFVQQQPGPEPPAEPPFPARTTDLGLGSHLGYAIQWFAFAAILAVGYVVVTYRRLHAPTHQGRPAKA
ncbi:MAG TPA: SURF1 family protein [Roseiflexaceae bacterium]|nr:SURF1 family protein [Roseiflexaceae bacterium]